MDESKSLKQIKPQRTPMVGYQNCRNQLQLLPSMVEYIFPPLNLSGLLLGMPHSKHSIMQVLNLSNKRFHTLLSAPLGPGHSYHQFQALMMRPRGTKTSLGYPTSSQPYSPMNISQESLLIPKPMSSYVDSGWICPSLHYLSINRAHSKLSMDTPQLATAYTSQLLFLNK